MANIVREEFAKIKAITGVTAIDNSADAIVVNGQSITFVNMSGKYLHCCSTARYTQ